VSHDEAVKQRDALVNEAAGLKMELQQVRDDRDRLILQVQNLTDEVVKYKEYTENSCSELDTLTEKTNQLEDKCFSQSNEISTLKDQLMNAQEKLQVSDISVLETKTEYEEQKRLISELQSRLVDAEFKLVEGEMLRKKLHNTIL
ncbi:kinesin-like protein KIN-14C, partial [Morus notabilis]